MVTTRRQASRDQGTAPARSRSRSKSRSRSNGEEKKVQSRRKQQTKKVAPRKQVPPRAKDNPPHEYEFLGPYVGPVGIVLGLPAVMYGLYGFCGSHGCVSLAPFSIPEFTLGKNKIISLEGFAVFLGWLLAVALLHICLPSANGTGVVLANGKRLPYRINGLLVYAVILGLIAWGYFGLKLSFLGYVYDHYVEIMTASVCASVVFSVLLYLASHRSENVLCAKGGNTGRRFYDFFIGRELNPRLDRFDLKEFCELYPGLIGWVVIDLAMACKQYESLGYVTNSMLLVCWFHAMYVADALYFEKAILTTMDIVHDGFGFMLVFGDLAWVPFTYTLQARYLVDYPKQLPNYFTAFVFVLQTAGYLAFRGANGQKDRFRTDPNSPKVKHIKYINTKRGTKLMVSGWWGIVRHVNYTADWIMGLSWCLCCGFDHLVPYFYAIYFGILLIHRDLRDGEACEKKYGKDWDKYCSIVKYRLIPFIY